MDNACKHHGWIPRARKRYHRHHNRQSPYLHDDVRFFLPPYMDKTNQNMLSVALRTEIRERKRTCLGLANVAILLMKFYKGSKKAELTTETERYSHRLLRVSLGCAIHLPQEW
uniref:DDE_3 domain-containing protein n=1 Tax=Steinernema glaseri TaxID=37863 RepID=A0A1I7ZC71_9BILA